MASAYERDPMVRFIATGLFAVAIAGIGAVMMGVTSSPAMKGAALLWLPAALQLMAGVWLGPWRGFLAAGVGAQLAGVIAYGGWAPADWIMNFFAGGFANALLPAVLFRLFSVDPLLPGPSTQARPSLIMIVLLAAAALVFAFVEPFLFNPSPIWYSIPLIIVLGVPALMGIGSSRNFILALAIAVFSCATSAAIGVAGSMVSGQSLRGAIITVGIGWFLGDTVSAVIGLHAMAALTPWARERGIAPA